MILFLTKLKRSLILLIFLFFHLSNQDEINFSNMNFPSLLTLLNQNVIMLACDGIHFFNPTLTIEDSSRKIIFDDKITQNADYQKTAMVQFSQIDDGYILILVKDKMYYFNSEGDLLDSKELSSYISSEYYYLIPYKKQDNYLHYIISYKNAEFNFTLSHFKYDITNNENEVIMQKKYNVSVQYNQNKNPSMFAGPSCMFMSPQSYDHDVLTCFYSTFYPTEIQSRSFDPDNNFEEIPEFFKAFFESTDSPCPNYVNAVTDDNKRKAFIILNTQCVFILNFDFQNFFYGKKNDNIDKYCSLDTSFYRNKLIYFSQTHEYVFISSLYGNPNVPINIYNEDFSLKEKGYFEAPGVYGINSFSSFWNGVNYSLIYDNNNADNPSITIGEVTNLRPGDNVETTTPTSTVPAMPSTSLTTESIKKNIKCKTENSESIMYNLCTECDNEQGYFSAEFLDNSFLHGFLECYNSDTKPNNFYFDNSEQKYKQCYETCKTCNEGGNEIINNCLECENNYIKKPDDPSTTNCVINCQYMYYYDSYGQYKCTNDNLCPEEAKIYIQPLNKCTEDCKKETDYRYKYGGRCLENCPEYTSPNDNNICIDQNLNSCTKTDNKIEEKQILDLNEIDINAKNYAEEFSYTTKHVSHFFNNLYSILIYKDLKCIEELSLDMPKADFDSCFNKVIQNLDPPTDDNIIIALIEKLNFKKKSTTVFSFYHPITGEKIDIGTICSDEQVTVKESVLYQLNNSKVDLESALFLVKQGIDIFNISHEFYNDICFIFDSPNGKDITLKDRMLTYYPNITLCDDGCINNGVNLTSMESLCECKVNNLINNDLLNDDLFGEAFGGIANLLSSSNILVLQCYKQVFVKKNIFKNVGSYIVFGITGVQIICSILFFSLDMVKIFKYIYNLTEVFIKYAKKKAKNKSFNINNSTESAPPKKDEKYKSKTKNKDIKNKSRNFKGFKILPYNYDSTKNKLGNQKDLSYLTKSSSKNVVTNSSFRKDTTNDIEVYNYKEIMNEFTHNTNTDKSQKNLVEDIDMKEYLKPEFDEMEYDDAIKYDNRTFCEYYWDRLKDKQIIINTFCNKENLKPITIKIILLLLNIELYFVVNGLFYSEEYISGLFYSNEEETFFSFLKRSIERLLYTTVVGVIVESLIEFIFLDENRIKRIFKREKDNFVHLKFEIFQIIRNIKKRFIIFIILCFIIALFSWYYANCFNNAYPGIKTEWVKSSIVIMVIMQILPIITGFIESILRTLSFKCKSETLFEIKKYFS